MDNVSWKKNLNSFQLNVPKEKQLVGIMVKEEKQSQSAALGQNLL